jgi:hypothetical protein
MHGFKLLEMWSLGDCSQLHSRISPKKEMRENFSLIEPIRAGMKHGADMFSLSGLER